MKKSYLLFTALLISVGLQTISAQTYTITTVAGTGDDAYNGDGFPAIYAKLNSPRGVALDAAGNLYISESYSDRIRKVDAADIISTVVGFGTEGYNGDSIYAPSAMLADPQGISFDKHGNMYIADRYNNRIRKVDTAGKIYTIAGIGSFGYNGDNVAATQAELDWPNDVKVDHLGNVYIADTENHRIRKIDPAGIITTFAGGGTDADIGYEGPATDAILNRPWGIAIDNSGNIYFTERYNHTIRKINTVGVIKTIAGTGTQGYSGDNGLATAAELFEPKGIALDAWGNIYFADIGNHVIRKIDNLGIITTIAGNAVLGSGYNGDNIPATSAKLYEPHFLVVDELGNIYFADTENHRVRKLTPSNLSTASYTKTSFKIYPNPVNHELTIESDGNIETIEIYDAVGRLMQDIQPISGVVKIDISSYTNGTYFITMKTKSGEVFREKVIKQ